MPKELGQILIENAKKQSGGCWMQNFIPIIQDSVKQWLYEHKVTTGADDSPRMYDLWLSGLIDELQSNENKETNEVKQP